MKKEDQNAIAKAMYDCMTEGEGSVMVVDPILHAAHLEEIKAGREYQDAHKNFVGSPISPKQLLELRDAYDEARKRSEELEK